MAKNEQPYQAFGAKIKYLRQQWKQTVSEVSGTLEIDEIFLKDIESGKVLPTGSLMDLLINHFLLTAEQAQELKHLANFHPNHQSPENVIGGIEDMLMKQIVMYMPIDQKVVYTDGMNVTVNKHGVTLQFTQNNQPKSELNKSKASNIVSQVGMSREHAEKIIYVLQKTLREHDQTEKPKFLPRSDSDKNNKPKKFN